MHIACVQNIFKAQISRLAKHIFQNLDVVTLVSQRPVSTECVIENKPKQQTNQNKTNTVLLGFQHSETVHTKCVILRTTQNLLHL